jgi:hypothetical protein
MAAKRGTRVSTKAPKKTTTAKPSTIADEDESASTTTLPTPSLSAEPQPPSTTTSPCSDGSNVPELPPADDTTSEADQDNETSAPPKTSSDVEGQQTREADQPDEELGGEKARSDVNPPQAVEQEPHRAPHTPQRTDRHELVDRPPIQINTPPSKPKAEVRIRDVEHDQIIDKVYMGTAVLCVAALDPIWPVNKSKPQASKSPLHPQLLMADTDDRVNMGLSDPSTGHT